MYGIGYTVRFLTGRSRAETSLSIQAYTGRLLSCHD